METIQIVLAAPLLRETDRAARRLKVNRSALVRAALQEHLKRLQTIDKEARDREGYRRRSQDRDDLAAWDKVAAWPDA
jgi:metal-responsive CopG/Arc/MetJ family transcriptional regulator